MSTGNEADQGDRGFELAVGFGAGIGGVVVATVFGLLALLGPELQFGFFVVFLFGYAFACVGVTVVVQHYVDLRLVSAIICGGAALLLTVLILARREDFDEVGLLTGAFFVACLVWWGYKAYRGHLQLGR